MTIVRREVLRRGLIAGGAGLAAPYVIRQARAAEHVLKCTMADVVTNPVYDVLLDFAENVKKKTDGAIEIKVYGAGQLGSQNNILTGLQTGIIDFTAHTTGYIETIFPKIAVLDLPYLLRSNEQAEQVLDGPIGAQLLEPFPSKGIYGLCWGHWGWRNVDMVSRNVPQPADMNGVKIRIQPGAIYAATYKTLGATPIAIDVSEVYVALSQHAVDAVELPSISIKANKFYEVAKFLNLTRFVYNAGVLMASKRKLDSLSASQQAAIREAAKELSAEWRQHIAEKDAEALTFLKSQGTQVSPVDTDAYIKATKPVYDQFRDVLGADLIAAVQKQTGNG